MDPEEQVVIHRLFNYDLSTIVTPINVDKLEELLIRSQYDEEESRFLVEGYRRGFDIGYRGPTLRRDRSKNLPFWVGNNKIMWNKVMKEIHCG